MTLLGKTGSRGDYRSTPTTSATDDSPIHEMIGKTHMEIIRPAFLCDLIRVATFQWSPGTNHVSFRDLYAEQPDGILMHHPTSHLINNSYWSLSAPLRRPRPCRWTCCSSWPTCRPGTTRRWRTSWSRSKNTTDIFGGNLLANTVIPYVTEVAETNHAKRRCPRSSSAAARWG